MAASVQCFLSGMVTAGFILAGAFFARSWSRSRDFLFLAFSGAFCLLALNQAFVALVPEPEEQRGWVYLLRVAAFLLIAIAIVRKNVSDAEQD